jgi:hypothetical protein
VQYFEYIDQKIHGIDKFKIESSYQIRHLFYLFQFQSILFLKTFKLGNFITVSFKSEYFFLEYFFEAFKMYSNNLYDITVWIYFCKM